jgi:hypothetical protein
MYVTASVLAMALLPAAVSASGSGSFSYDPASSTGPLDWPSLVIPNKTNECGGAAQSGIDIPTGGCDETNANYIFEVSGVCMCLFLLFSIGLL